MSCITKQTIKLENNAEGYLFSLTGEQLDNAPAKGEDGKFPLITLIHGGPFAAAPCDGFNLQWLFLILQGYKVFVVNYRGSIGFGKDFLDSLLGEIGNVDVHDCG